MTKASVVGLMIVAVLMLGACNRSASHEMTEAERQKILEEKKRNANWGKSINDAQRMEEISRQRAQQQRDQKN